VVIVVASRDDFTAVDGIIVCVSVDQSDVCCEECARAYGMGIDDVCWIEMVGLWDVENGMWVF